MRYTEIRATPDPESVSKTERRAMRGGSVRRGARRDKPLRMTLLARDEMPGEEQRE